jgi:Leucine-rich repeat (LRR) protein
MTNYKKLYDSLIQSEELLEIFPQLKGNWEKDKEKFIKIQNQMENLTMDFEVKLNKTISKHG